MLLICPVRPGDSNEELRYALRSWETNLVLDTPLTLLVVGHCPPWLEPDIFVEGNLTESSPINVFENVLAASREAARLGYTDAVYMNDDFFCLDPVAKVVPVRRDRTLAEHVGQFSPASTHWWVSSLRLTASWLSGEGIPHPESFEVHRPLPAAPERMVWALEQWLDQPGNAKGPVRPQWRTLYGALSGAKAYPVRDVKVETGHSGVGTPWISTSDEVWRAFATRMRRKFPETSRWERQT